MAVFYFMARAYTNEDLREVEGLLKEAGDERAYIAEELHKMRKFDLTVAKKEDKIEGVVPEHLLRAQKESLEEKHLFR